MSSLYKKNFNTPDSTQNIGRIKVEKVSLGSLDFMRSTAEPGWKWSEDIKPSAKTESCQLNHLIYIISGKLKVRMDNGLEIEFNPGDIGSITPGHDGWTVGDQPAVWIELPQ